MVQIPSETSFCGRVFINIAYPSIFDYFKALFASQKVIFWSKSPIILEWLKQQKCQITAKKHFSSILTIISGISAPKYPIYHTTTINCNIFDFCWNLAILHANYYAKYLVVITYYTESHINMVKPYLYHNKGTVPHIKWKEVQLNPKHINSD